MSVAVVSEKETVPRVKGQMVTVMSCDGVKFERPEEVYSGSAVFFSNLLRDFPCTTEFPIWKVTGNVFEKALVYFDKHHADPIEEGDAKPGKPKEISEWDAEFLGQLDQTILFELVLAANYLDAKGLLGLTCLHIANMMKGKTPQQIRDQFGIKQDLTEEEEEEIRRENAWVFE